MTEQFSATDISFWQTQAANGRASDYEDQTKLAAIIAQLALPPAIEAGNNGDIEDGLRAADLEDNVTTTSQIYDASRRVALLIALGPGFFASLLTFAAFFYPEGPLPWLSSLLMILSVGGVAWYYHPKGGVGLRPGDARRNRRAAEVELSRHVRRIPTQRKES